MCDDENQTNQIINKIIELNGNQIKLKKLATADGNGINLICKCQTRFAMKQIGPIQRNMETEFWLTHLELIILWWTNNIPDNSHALYGIRRTVILKINY